MTNCINAKLQEYKIIWEETKLDKSLSLLDNAVIELSDYFALEKERVVHNLLNGEEILADEWNNFFRDKRLIKNEIVEFYNQTKNEIFELMQWHYINFLSGPLQYAFSLRVAIRNGLTDYLDYGSGIGTGGILFSLHNFSVSLADVSTQNLAFCKYRFQKRHLDAEFIDLKNEQIRQDAYDIITCFDVLEHTLHPTEILNTIKTALRDDGILIVAAPFYKDDNRPMHIATNQKIINSIRSLGFSYRWDLMKECGDGIKRQVFVLKKASRGVIFNKLYWIYDNTPLNLKKKISRAYKYLCNKNE